MFHAPGRDTEQTAARGNSAWERETSKTSPTGIQPPLVFPCYGADKLTGSRRTNGLDSHSLVVHSLAGAGGNGRTCRHLMRSKEGMPTLRPPHESGGAIFPKGGGHLLIEILSTEAGIWVQFCIRTLRSVTHTPYEVE